MFASPSTTRFWTKLVMASIRPSMPRVGKSTVAPATDPCNHWCRLLWVRRRPRNHQRHPRCRGLEILVLLGNRLAIRELWGKVRGSIVLRQLSIHRRCPRIMPPTIRLGIPSVCPQLRRALWREREAVLQVMSELLAIVPFPCLRVNKLLPMLTCRQRE